jgi:shikimate kinase
MKVFLIGFMASGKSSVGKKLANKLNLPFVDLDTYIEEKHNTTIRLLMYDKGHDAFREIERDALVDVIENYQDAIISTGGGTPCYFDNLEKMKNAGDTVYLEVDIPTLVDRLMHSKKDRPLIWGKTREDLTVYAKELMERRRGYYQKAKYTVNGKNLKLDTIIQIIE